MSSVSAITTLSLPWLLRRSLLVPVPWTGANIFFSFLLFGGIGYIYTSYSQHYTHQPRGRGPCGVAASPAVANVNVASVNAARAAMNIDALNINSPKSADAILRPTRSPTLRPPSKNIIPEPFSEAPSD